MTHLNFRALPFTLLALVAPFFVSTAYALSVGEMSVNSNLGEPLDISISVAVGDKSELETLKVKLAPREAFIKIGAPYPVAADEIIFAIDDENGNSTLHITTVNALDTPYLHLLMQLSWSGGNMLREYIALIDPADFNTRVENTTISEVDEEKPIGVVHSGDWVTVVGGDTVSSIAEGYRPSDVSIQQAWVALYNLNRGAFPTDNIDLIEKGVRLKIPTRDQMLALTQQNAINKVSSLSPASKAIKGKLRKLGNSDAQVMASEPSELGQQDVLTIGASSDLASDSSSNGLNSAAVEELLEGEFGEMASIKTDMNKFSEELVAARGENKVLANRLASVETQLSKISQLLELQSQTLAALNEQARQQAKGIRDETNQSAAAQNTQNLEEDLSQNNEGPVLNADDVTGSVVSAKNKILTSIDEGFDNLTEGTLGSSLTGFLSKWGLYILAGFLALIGLGTFMRRRGDGEQRNDGSDFVGFAEGEQDDDSIHNDLRRQNSFGFSLNEDSMIHVDDSDSESEVNSTLFAADDDSMIEEMESDVLSHQSTIGQVMDVDPLAEAEVYLAYDRKEQAIKVLKDAYDDNPTDQEIGIKLMSLYEQSEDQDSFGRVLETAYANRDESVDGDKWLEIKSMGKAFMPTHTLFLDNDFDSSIPILFNEILDEDVEELIEEGKPIKGKIEGKVSEITGVAAGAVSSDADDANHNALDKSSPLFESKSDGDKAELDTKDAGSFTLDMDSETGDTLGQINQHDSDTSLALAKAYIELGEVNIAKDFLKDVISSGSDKLKTEANALLKGLKS